MKTRSGALLGSIGLIVCLLMTTARFGVTEVPSERVSKPLTSPARTPCDTRLGCEKTSTKQSQMVLWHHSWSDDPRNIPLLAKNRFVTHVVIGNLDYNEQPISSVAYKVDLIKKAGMIPVWERDLWFQDTDYVSLPEAAHFIDQQQRGVLHFNPFFYAWFLKKLHTEARAYGVSHTFIDIEPHDEQGAMRSILRGDGTAEWANHLDKIARRALLIPGSAPAHFISPSDMFIVHHNGFRALKPLGKNHIAVNTYFNCYSRLEWSTAQQFELIGIWATTDSSCHRDGNSCDLTTYGKSCPYTEEGSNRALWNVEDIFRNEAYWRNIGRGIYLYTNNNRDSFSVPKSLYRYCYSNSHRCRP